MYIDEGIRRGNNIFKALALNVQVVLVGRPILWSLFVYGAYSVAAGSGDLTQRTGMSDEISWLPLTGQYQLNNGEIYVNFDQRYL